MVEFVGRGVKIRFKKHLSFFEIVKINGCMFYFHENSAFSFLLKRVSDWFHGIECMEVLKAHCFEFGFDFFDMIAYVLLGVGVASDSDDRSSELFIEG